MQHPVTLTDQQATGLATVQLVSPECRTIGQAEFQLVQSLSRPFTLDACCNADGSNALCDNWCSPANSFLQVDSLADQHVWVNAPFRKVKKFVRHYLQVKAKTPDRTSACILVPRWTDPPWKGVLHGMQLLHSFPAGYPLFVTPGESRPMPGTPWPVDIYYDPPYQAVKAAAACTADEDRHMIMCFRGSANSKEAVIALDTQASDCFIDAHFVKANHIATTQVHKMVELANGSYTQLKAQCEVRIKITGKRGKAYQGTVPCFVVDLGGDYDIILGQDWLLKQKATLSYETKSVSLAKDGIVIKTMGKPPALKGVPLVSAMTIRREMQVSSKWFMVSVVDDKVTGLVPEASGETQTLAGIPPDISPQVRQTLVDFAPVFGSREGLPPDRGTTHRISELPDSKPVYKTPYRLSPLEMAEAEKQIKELLKAGLIEPSKSPYGAPILFVGKKDGSLRMCCDWRRLNSQTVKSRYPIPRIDHLLDQLHGAKWFTTLDLQPGYHQILVHPDDVEKTAFTTVWPLSVEGDEFRVVQCTSHVPTGNEQDFHTAPKERSVGVPG